MDLANRVALVTGARRIGGVVAAELARHGAAVALSYNRSQSEAEQAAAAVRSHGRPAFVHRANLTDAAECEALVAATVEALGRLDILINMASLYLPKPFDALTVEAGSEHAVDLRAAFACARAAVPHMRRGRRHIVNFSDWLAKSGRPRTRGICRIMWPRWRDRLTEGLALSLLRQDSRQRDSTGADPCAAGDHRRRARRRREVHAGAGARDGDRPGGIGAACCDFITGETIRVDGGRHVR